MASYSVGYLKANGERGGHFMMSAKQAIASAQKKALESGVLASAVKIDSINGSKELLWTNVNSEGNNPIPIFPFRD